MATKDKVEDLSTLTDADVQFEIAQRASRIDRLVRDLAGDDDGEVAPFYFTQLAINEAYARNLAALAAAGLISAEARDEIMRRFEPVVHCHIQALAAQAQSFSTTPPAATKLH